MGNVPVDPTPPRRGVFENSRAIRDFLFYGGLIVIIAIWAVTLVREETTGQAAPGSSAAGCERPDWLLERAAVLERTDQVNFEYKVTDEEGDPNLSVQNLVSIYRCLEPYEAVVFVEGLPDVSGIYQSRRHARDRSERTTIFSAFAGDVGQCTVGSLTRAFQTKLTEQRSSEFVTVDVGVSGGGEPFVGITKDEPVSDGAIETTINYVSEAWNGISGANAEIKVNARFPGMGVPGDVPNVLATLPPSANALAGIVSLESTFHNNRKYFPFTNDEWQGDPIYIGTITVVCG